MEKPGFHFFCLFFFIVKMKTHQVVNVLSCYHLTSSHCSQMLKREVRCCEIRLDSPRCSESTCGLWEKEVPFQVCSSSFSFTWVMVSQSRTLAGTVWVVVPPLAAAAGITTFSVWMDLQRVYSSKCCTVMPVEAINCADFQFVQLPMWA